MSAPREENLTQQQPQATILDKQGNRLFVLMVVVGYVVTFAFIAVQERTPTSAELAWGILFGVVYTLVGLYNRLIFDRVPRGWADLLFFSVQLGLVFGIGQVLGVVGNLLVGLPLVAFAVERLKPWPRLLVYVGLAAAVVAPIGLRFSPWSEALVNGLTAITAILFVAVFADMRRKEQQTRERAERLMAELEAANAQLAAYATQAEELAMTQERNRMAREIHDNLGHYLTIVNVQIEAARVVMESDQARALDAMDKAQELTQKGLTRVRESVAALRESPISNRPLGEAIAALVEETQSSGIVAEFEVGGEPVSLEHKVALALYRAAQEGLTNVCRHARASRVDVWLHYQPTEVRLEVRDNGVGAAETAGGFGLLGIRERMQLLGGKLKIDTGVGQGFRLAASVPLSQADQPLQAEE
jgi:signal transduction histidine kinase